MIRVNWQPIETAPREKESDEDYSWVLVYQPKGRHPCTPIKHGVSEFFLGCARDDQERLVEWPHDEALRVAHHDDYSDSWWTGEAYDSEELWPTHWAPLPEPPEKT
jgi:hypothetical protein